MCSNVRLTIIDHGNANLRSLIQAIVACGVTPRIAENADNLGESDALVLPGVGAFGRSMDGLSERGLLAPVRELAVAGIPLLGVCLGMQLLLDSSEEFGNHRGLGLISGRVTRLTVEGGKVPHVGWAPLILRASCPILAGLDGCQMYFVHSYHAEVSDTADIAATARHGQNHFTAVIRRGNVFGCQFHPERSAVSGLRLISQFLSFAQAHSDGRPWNGRVL